MMDLLPNKKQFRADEVASLFGVTTKTVYRWIEEEKLKAEKTPGGQLRIWRSELQKFLKD